MLIAIPISEKEGEIQEILSHEGTESVIDGVGFQDRKLCVFLRVTYTGKRNKLRFIVYRVRGISFSLDYSVRPIGTVTTRYSDEDETLIVYEVL
ncbi:MAG: hypothetical protein LBF15_01095 [Candidatus Peribacteria bacterium]|nr:hypothetical protein [Candidatus Peribacteria bacterium]